MCDNPRMSHTERGNILFLILLAVVLFAALSYAVTSSMRGGGKDASDEKLSLMASEILNQVALWRTAHERLRIPADVRQIHFNDSAKTTSGTCYEGSTAITPCATVGLFSDATLTKPHSEKDWFVEAAKNYNYHFVWINSRVTQGGVEAGGTTQNDSFIQLQYLTDDLCRKINQMTQGQNTIFTSTVGTGGAGRAYVSFYEDTMTSSGFTTDTYGLYDFAYDNACYDQDGSIVANFMLRAQ